MGVCDVCHVYSHFPPSRKVYRLRNSANKTEAACVDLRSTNKYLYGAKALDQLVREYNDNIPTRNLHFLMGTMASHPRTFIIIGLLRSGFDPQELARQGHLF
jgi:hypothetical protein